MTPIPPEKPKPSLPNWLLYTGVALAISLGAAKILRGLWEIYR